MTLFRTGAAWCRRLSVRVTIGVAAVLLLFAGLVVAGTSFEAETTLREHLLTRAEDLGGLVSELAASHLDELQAFELELILEDVARQHEVQKVQVIDLQGNVIADGDPDTSFFLKRSASVLVAEALASGRSVRRVDGTGIELAVPVRLGRKLVGAVRLTMTLNEVGQTLRRVERGLLMLVAGLLALALPLAAALVSHATRDIRAMTAAVRGVTGGNLDVRFPTRAAGEVGELQDAFAHMLGNLQAGLVEIERLAFTDLVTGLPNRQAFRRSLEAAIEHPGASGALLFVDLDGFKQVNDMLGHDVGDELLRQVGGRFGAALPAGPVSAAGPSAAPRDAPFLARLGGDEFTVVLPALTSADAAGTVAEALVDALDRPFDLHHHKVAVSASVGVTLFPGDGSTAERLLKNADLAMYAAKDAGRGTVRFYAADLERLALERLTLERELRAALGGDELVVHYQPQVSCETGRIVAAEALVRWNHPNRGLLGPASFLPLAEETGLVDDLGWFVLERAVRDGAALAAAGRPLPMAVNVSALQFERADFVERVLSALERSGLPPSLLELELTESVAMRNAERVIARLGALRDCGVRVAIDDFGTGYSSLSYLSRLPIDTIKIDGAFVRAAARSSSDEALVRLILQMADSLGLKTIAEGIESEEDFAFARRHGTDTAQGFLFSPALPLREFAAFAGLFRAWPGRTVEGDGSRPSGAGTLEGRPPALSGSEGRRG